MGNFQLTIGKGNKQIMGNNVVLEVQNTVSKMEEIFREYDEKMCELYGQIIDSKRKKEDDGIDNKTKIEFRSQKIFLSLIKIGVPLDNAYQIVINVTDELITHEDNGLYNGGKLSTHEIRKVVAYKILHCNLEGVPLKEIEEWGDKYVRRYGHDSQRTKIYYKDSSNDNDVSYAFVKDSLLHDIIEELGIKKYIYGGDIKKNQLKSMSEDVVDFINNCNMYKIRYDILKEFICEMALQPPHPWLVTSETAEKIRQYDIEAVEKHYKKIEEKIKYNDFSEEHYTICEMLHHSCSSILAGYNEILGCKDLDAFFNLEKIVNKLYNNEHDLVMEYNIDELPSDLKYIGIDFYDFHVLLNRIRCNIENKSHGFNVSAQFLKDILKLYNIAVDLFRKVNKQKMKCFLYSSWKDYNLLDRREYIKLFFESIDYMHTNKFFFNMKNCFWLESKHLGKRKFLVVCLDKNLNFSLLYTFINQIKIKRILESILLILEDEEQVIEFQEQIDKINPREFDVEILYKNDLQRIFGSVNKLRELHKILRERINLGE